MHFFDKYAWIRYLGYISERSGGITPQEAEALSGKAADLMAKYGIERARLGALHPETDKPADKVYTIEDPYASTKIFLLNGITLAMGGRAVQINGKGGVKLHVFGYQSDLDRIEMMYTSLLVQMHRAMTYTERGLSSLERKHIRAWRRSFMLGYQRAVVSKVRAAEDAARRKAEGDDKPGETSMALVLADRSLVVKTNANQAYPRTKTGGRTTYRGTGYGSGYSEGQKADIGGARVGRGSRGALGR
jgi:hypothetical protein